MSLFKTREWWSTQCGSGEEFDSGSLCVANIDNSPDGSVKIVTGSFEGFLHISSYVPHHTWSLTMLGIYSPKNGEMKPEDLLLEQNLGQPILQVSEFTLGLTSSAFHTNEMM
jgi:Bardet-Biedl syndrome 9 protein